jgi:phage-related protein
MKKRYLILAACAAIIIALLSVVYLMAQRAYSPGKKNPEQAQTEKNSSPSMTKTSNDSAPASTQKTIPTPPACGQFTQQLAKQIIGDDATVDTNNSIINSETTDMQVGTCVYTAHQKSVRLVSHIAKTDLGRSANAVVFGSNRPSATQVVQGYGQAAFWDNNTNTLSVLKNNNQYDISVSGDLHDTEPAAAIIVPKL